MHNARALKSVDYGSILLIVYSAFSQGVVNGIWHQIDAIQLFRLVLVDAALLATVITILTFASRQLIRSPSTPEEFAAFVKGERAKWEPVVSAVGIKLD
jgi:predicted Na+-dependent transporter